MDEANNAPSSQPSSGGMNWKIIVGIVVVVLVVGGIIFSLGGSSPSDTGGSTENKTSLKNLLAMSGSQKCAVSSKNENAESSGNVYVTNGMMRGDFTSMAAGQTMASHMIVKSNTSYVWTDGMAQGFMMTFGDAPTSNEGTPEQAVDVNQEYSYDCDDWTPDQSIFELPANVTFTDIAEMMQGQIPAGMMPGGN